MSCLPGIQLHPCFPSAVCTWCPGEDLWRRHPGQCLGGGEGLAVLTAMFVPEFTRVFPPLFSGRGHVGQRRGSLTLGGPWVRGQLGSVSSCSMVLSTLRGGLGPSGWWPWCSHLPPALAALWWGGAGPQTPQPPPFRAPALGPQALLLGEVRSGGRGRGCTPTLTILSMSHRVGAGSQETIQGPAHR